MRGEWVRCMMGTMRDVEGRGRHGRNIVEAEGIAEEGEG